VVQGIEELARASKCVFSATLNSLTTHATQLWPSRQGTSGLVGRVRSSTPRSLLDGSRLEVALVNKPATLFAMRLFVAIPLASTAVEELSAICAQLKSARDGLRWTAPASWHITLQFLGETQPRQCQHLIARLAELSLPPVPVQLQGLGFFDRAGIFYAGIRETRELLSLEQRVTATTAHCGFATEIRPYHPHITLARVKGKAAGWGTLKDRLRSSAVSASFVAREFFLIESFLGSGPPRYETRASFSLTESN